jgi:NAD(P)-dependent dehydrogenase (short-subunit alcohol dehydrogenase family)
MAIHWSRKTTAALAMGVGSVLLLRARRRRSPYLLSGRTVLITGGSRGLGLALAWEAAAQGARVAICGRDPGSLERARVALARAGAAVAAFPCDVGDRAAVERLVSAVGERFGAIDVLINNAGIIEVGPATLMSVADFETAMATNFWGMLYPTLAVLPEMRVRRSGRVVNITSVGGRISVPHLLPYNASKFAAVGLSQGLRAELAADGIRVVTVCPGLMRTGSPRNAIFAGKHRAEYAWFSIGDSLPGLTISAERAARRILEACKRGDPEVRFPLATKAAVVVNALAPRLTAHLLGAANRLLPSPGSRPSGKRRGAESQSWLSPSWLTRLTDRAARRYNQIAPAEPVPH